MRTTILAALALAALLGAGGVASAQGTLLDSYCAWIGEADHFASNGQTLTDAASIIRQDRANFHRFGVSDSGDEADATFQSREARERIPAMLAEGSIDPDLAREIVNGTPEICVEVYSRSISVFRASAPAFGAPDSGDLPFLGVWDCEVSIFTFTPSVYNNGFEDLPILDIQEGTDGSYAIFLSDEYYIVLSGFRGDSMGWFSPESGDAFNCQRLE